MCDRHETHSTDVQNVSVICETGWKYWHITVSTMTQILHGDSRDRHMIGMPHADHTVPIDWWDRNPLAWRDQNFLHPWRFDDALMGVITGNQDFSGGTVDKNPAANAGTWVRSLVQESSTCLGEAKPMHHSCWAQVLQLLKPLHL